MALLLVCEAVALAEWVVPFALPEPEELEEPAFAFTAANCASSAWMRAFSWSISVVVEELEDDELPPPPPPPPARRLDDAAEVVEPDEVLDDVLPEAVLLLSELAAFVFADVDVVAPLAPGAAAAIEVVDWICMVLDRSERVFPVQSETARGRGA